MKTRPILFKSPMVRAILAGRKRVTRRLVKWPVLTRSDGAKQRLLYECDVAVINQMLAEKQHHPLRKPQCPYGAPGDGLWVRETWGLRRPFDDTDWMPRRAYARTDEGVVCCGEWEPDYRADWGEMQGECVWRPSIHMPRWASRITLRVTDVRVERLQDISEEDAKAEGVEVETGLLPEQRLPRFFGNQDAVLRDVPYRFPYSVLWDSINGPGAWDANPWVWRVGFERVTP